jgi:hypothetical protein
VGHDGSESATRAYELSLTLAVKCGMAMRVPAVAKHFATEAETERAQVIH